MTMTRGLTQIVPHQREIANRPATQTVVREGKERIQDLIRESTMEVQSVLGELRETIARTEAEFEVDENISIVLERDRKVFSVSRKLRFAKDR